MENREMEMTWKDLTVYSVLTKYNISIFVTFSIFSFTKYIIAKIPRLNNFMIEKFRNLGIYKFLLSVHQDNLIISIAILLLFIFCIYCKFQLKLSLNLYDLIISFLSIYGVITICLKVFIF
jgi:hypothetical protein